jgi:hypothetical protein
MLEKMISHKQYIFLYLLLILVLASCTKPNQNYARDRYIVTSKNLNIRIDPTQLSKTIGTLSKGDTIIALASDRYWVMVKIDDQTGFVSSEYLKKLSPIAAPKFVNLVERNADWKLWQFWLISVMLIALWISAELGLVKYENRLKKSLGIGAKKVSVAPLIFFVAGIMTGVLYLFWKDQVIESIFVNLTFLPKGMGSIAWIIWIQCLSIVLAMIIDFIGSIYRSGLKYGHVIFLIEQGINLVIFSATFFLTISMFVAAIVFLVIFFAILYTIIVTENSKSFSGLFS